MADPKKDSAPPPKPRVDVLGRKGAMLQVEIKMHDSKGKPIPHDVFVNGEKVVRK